MELRDIIALCNAGFSKSEIMAFAQPAPVAQPENVEQTTLLDAINGLTAQIKTMNIAQTEQPKPQTAEDVLASIILPSK